MTHTSTRFTSSSRPEWIVAMALLSMHCGDDRSGETTDTATSPSTGAIPTTSGSTGGSTTDTPTTDATTTDATTTDATTTAGTGSSTTGGADYTFTVTPGFAVPESCMWDPATKLWYVSNIAPQSMDLTMPDGMGWISRVAPDGAIVDAQWVTGLNTPAGLTISKGVLFVNDITQIHEIDVATGNILLTHEFPNAGLLNDPAIDEASGTGYATDTFGSAIYQFKVGMGGSEIELLTSPDLQGPNGLLFSAGALYVASLVDFDPMNLGPFLKVDPATKAISQIGDTLGKFDGLEPWKDGFLLSDNQVGRLVAFDAMGASEVVFDLLADHGFAPAADHGVDPVGSVICVPNLMDSIGFVRY